MCDFLSISSGGDRRPQCCHEARAEQEVLLQGGPDGGGILSNGGTQSRWVRK